MKADVNLTSIQEAIKAGLKTGMLSFGRSVQISEAMLYGRSIDDESVRRPVEITEKGVRGQTSNDISAKAANDKKTNPGKPNPQVVHAAVLPAGTNQLEIHFSARVMGGALSPMGCDNADVHAAHVLAANLYSAAGGFKTLAELYIWNIANGRFAWRNRFMADVAVVTVSAGMTSISFNPFALSLDVFEGVDSLKNAVVEGDVSGVDALIEGFGKGLSGDAVFTFECSYLGTMAPFSEVFPSQEYIRDEGSARTKDISRVYASISNFSGERRIDHASIHSQKIGAALRCIDVWHGNEKFGAVPINPFAGDQGTSEVLRLPGSGKSFYDIRNNVKELFGDLEAGKCTPEAHFFFANLVRGGVFSSAK